MNWAPWEGATNCTGGPEPGARALLAWLQAEYDQASSLGIYNCRSVRGSTTTSMHGEGRAVDLKWPMSSAGKGTASGERVVSRLGEHGKRLGIQCVIYNRQIWSPSSPNGRYYGGVNPHHDHHHIELTRAAGRNLTLATLRAVLGTSSGGATEEDDVYVVKKGQSGARVRRAQRVIQAAGEAADLGNLLPEYGADGDYGTETINAVNTLARRAGLPADGETGMDVLVLDYCRNWLSG